MSVRANWEICGWINRNKTCKISKRWFKNQISLNLISRPYKYLLDNFPKQKLFVLLTEINHNLIIGNKYKLLLLRHIMNKKLVTLIIVVLISFCFLSIVVADNISQTHNDSIVPDKSDDIQPSDKNVTPEKINRIIKPKETIF